MTFDELAEVMKICENRKPIAKRITVGPLMLRALRARLPKIDSAPMQTLAVISGLPVFVDPRLGRHTVIDFSDGSREVLYS